MLTQNVAVKGGGEVGRGVVHHVDPVPTAGMEPVSCYNSNLKKKVTKACKSGFENSTPCKKGFATLKK